MQHLRIAHPAFADVLSGKKIVQLSDLHFHQHSAHTAQAVLSRLREIQPDMILLTGDYVRWYGSQDDYEHALSFLGQLQAPLGVYAVMGDADYSFSRASCLFCHRRDSADPPVAHRVIFLRDCFVDLAIGGRWLRLAGLDCWPPLRPNLALVDSLLASEHPTILLSHTSLAYARVPASAHALVLSGDTHGGQIRLPGLLWRITGRKPDPDHLRGFFQEGNKMLYVTSGIGTTDIPIRLGVPPEIVVFEFERKD
ncbi:MAG: metallophosphoesterase [candidate division KSB1 bacterium]|nr:metallophosphoesterase [candidate division KSB1 bacterium]MDZ7273829.1 metallophosphoesterase [candidate division KSB1 bacterium]MDZ7285985.1 metallophosphoesterase [candidate division KSB1 bacterium]MDZ7299017.1 metallophosphoesterase [candidate division KSB1 bacterium]MDZ7349838.1 metallophosphoesterase [candidate division KSB1 bacterium]